MFNNYYEAVEEKERLEALHAVEYKINTHMKDGISFYTLVLLESKMKIEDLPSDMYFRGVKTEKDFKRFIDSGLAWELEPRCPFTWAEHEQMVDFKKKVDYCRATRADNYRVSYRLEGMEEE